MANLIAIAVGGSIGALFLALLVYYLYRKYRVQK